MRHILLALATATLVAPTSAFAQDEAPSVRVSYEDLNLATEAGRARFDRRLAAAVRRVCPAADVRDLAASLVSRRCIAETHTNAKAMAAAAMKTRGVAVAALPSASLSRP